MNVRQILAGGLVCCGAAFAWQSSGSSQTSGTSSQPTTNSGQTTGSQTTTSSSPSSTSTTATPTGTTGTSSSSDKLPEIKTQTYKGRLVDASCAMPGSGSGTASRSDGGAAQTAQTASGKESGTGSANRGTGKGGASDASCPVSSSTTRFALQTKDGRTVPFDSVGNERAQLALKNKKKWSEAASSGKTINAKVSAAMSGDKLTVVAID